MMLIHVYWTCNCFADGGDSGNTTVARFWLLSACYFSSNV